MNAKSIPDAMGQLLQGLQDLVVLLARQEAEKRVNELRSGVVHNLSFNCCEDLWPWFHRTFIAHSGPYNGPDAHGLLAPDISQQRVMYRGKNVNYCPFCGAKL